MRTKNMKQKRKAIPICYQKKSLSRSNTSLSQLLNLAAYKKRINNLVKNNRSLAVALQDSRCENAYQSNLLKDYARDNNQIMFARLKVKEMTKTITKLVTDLDEVMTCLNVNWTSNEYSLQKNGHHDRMQIKIPDMENIEEVSVLSENDKCTEGRLSQSFTSNEISSVTADDNEGTAHQIQPSDVESDINEIDGPPVLFVEDSKEPEMETHLIRKSRSSRKRIVDQESLTPELDIDFSFMHRGSSSRRQTQVFSARSTKSREKSKLTSEYATPKRSVSSKSITQTKLSSAMLDFENDCEDNKIPGNAFVNVNERGSKNRNSSPALRRISLQITDCDGDLNKPSDSPVKSVTNVLNNKLDASNHTLILSEDMELTDVINPVQQIIQENSFNVVKPLINSVIQLQVEGQNKELNKNTEKMCCENELNEISESVPVSSNCIQNLNQKENRITNSVITNSNCESSESFKHVNSFKERDSFSSPLPLRSRRDKKVISYKKFISTSDSDSESSPESPGAKISDVEKRNTVIFKGKKSCKKTSKSTSKVESTPSQCTNKVSLNTSSVYDLDVSNSKKPAKKQKSKSKKSSHDQEISKPLLQNCNVTKLKGVDYKFTKNEKPVSKWQENQPLQMHKSFFKEISPNSSIKKQLDDVKDTGIEPIINKSIDSAESQLSFGTTDFKQQEISSQTPRPESKRVSFASTDIICNFAKGSMSRTIADNKKICRTSKSAFRTEEIHNQQTFETKETVDCEKDKSPEDVSEAAPVSDDLLDFHEETELYTFSFPSNTHQITATADKYSSSETIVSSVNVSPQIHDSCHNPNSKKNQLTVKNKCRKLSLKENKSSKKRVQSCASGKIDKDIIFESLHSDSPAAQTINSCKELSLDNLKENIIHTNPQTLNIAGPKTRIKSKTSKQILSPVEDCNTHVAIDDCLIRTKPSLQRGSVSQTHKLLQEAHDKTSKKSSCHRLTPESSPVLKDIMNLEEKSEENRDSIKRRTKVVNYKEPSLHKKLRRN